jgi:hypothetical protein
VETIKCTACHADIPDSGLNIDQGFALCRPCGVLAPLDTCINGRRDEPIEKALGRITRLPPLGAWVSETDGTTSVGARTEKTFANMILFALAIMFSLGALILTAITVLMLLTITGITPDGYMPQTIDDHGNTTRSDPSILWMLAPMAVVFTLVDVLLWIAAFFLLVPQFEVRFSPNQGEIISGKGRFAKRQKFDPRSVHAVEDRITIRRSGNHGPTENRSIVLQTTHGPVEFGLGLSKDTHAWMIAVLRDRLITQTPASERATHPSPRCPGCHAAIAIHAMNVTEGVALCGSCKQIAKLKSLDLSGIVERIAIIDQIPPPRNCSVQQSKRGIRIVARQQVKKGLLHFGVAVTLYAFMIPFLVIGGTSLAVHWGLLPEDSLPMTSAASSSTPLPMRTATISTAVGLIVFAVASRLVCKACFVVFGCTTILIGRGKATLRHGIGILARSREIDLGSVRSVQVLQHGSFTHVDDMSICIHTDRKSIRFARNLDRNQQDWLAIQFTRHLPGQVS